MSIVNNLIYILGGTTLWNIPPKTDTWEYNPDTDRFKVVASMPIGKIQAAISEVNRKIYTFGGTSLAISFPIQATSDVFESTDFVTGIEDLSKNVYSPDDLVLHQNYPNPFNPTTNIKFQIPNTKYTTLKVYNILGKEVSTLVSNKLNILLSVGLDMRYIFQISLIFILPILFLSCSSSYKISNRTMNHMIALNGDGSPFKFVPVSTDKRKNNLQYDFYKHLHHIMQAIKNSGRDSLLIYVHGSMIEI